MTAADRTRRQSAADHAGRESRIEAVTRDLIADVGYWRLEMNDDEHDTGSPSGGPELLEGT